ncbi:MAG TPA: HAD family hydrolase [Smithellaceae bacterium]|nr:HAD family hydrolase [Smithellaceae bacterium]
MEIKGLSGLPAREINTLLFDLDGTIIDISKKAKILFYVRAFQRFKNYFNPVSFYFSFWKSMHHVRANNTERSNYNVFIERMAQLGRTTPQIIDSLASEMVEKDFQSLGDFFKPVHGAREAIVLANELGYRLVLATNPVFPRKTVLYRMEWAGLMPDDFLFITSSEDMNRCKPSVEFYDRLLTRLDLKPERCLMIGNNPADDLPAHDIGIRTFLVETPLSKKIVRKSITDQRLDARGTYPDLMNWMREGVLLARMS